MRKYKKILLSICFLMTIFTIFAKPYCISGDCMEPAIMDGQFCFLNTVSLYLQKNEIGDIIAFNHDGKPWISRIVGLEHDTIRITNRDIKLNNSSLDKPWISRNWSNWKCGKYAINTSFLIPTGHVFVLSDTLSAHHDDSRVFGPIPNSCILGRIW